MSDKTPIEILSNTLAIMTARAMETEAKLEEANANVDRWYQNWKRADEQLKTTEDNLKKARCELNAINSRKG